MLPRSKELLVFVLPDVRLDSGMLRRMLIDLGLHGLSLFTTNICCYSTPTERQAGSGLSIPHITHTATAHPHRHEHVVACTGTGEGSSEKSPSGGQHKKKQNRQAGLCGPGSLPAVAVALDCGSGALLPGDVHVADGQAGGAASGRCHADRYATETQQVYPF